MKIALSLCFAALALTSAHAQMYRPDTGRGSDSARHGHAGDGRSSGGDRRDFGGSVRVGVSSGSVYNGHGGDHWGHARSYNYGPSFGFYGPGYGYGYAGYYPTYSYYGGYGDGYPYYGSTGYYGSTSAAANGLLLGALAGGIIGHNSGEFRHNGWRGAAWGAGAGWLLGSIADANRRPTYTQAPVVVQQAAPAAQSQPAVSQPAPQQITIINNYYGTPMSGANSLFGR